MAFLTRPAKPPRRSDRLQGRTGQTLPKHWNKCLMTEQELQRYLSRRACRPVVLRINNNVQNLVSASNGKPRNVLKVSVHRMFLKAEPEVLTALSQFIVKPSAASRRVIREYIANHSHQIVDKRRKRKPAGTAEGEYYDLQPIAERLNRLYFDNELEFDIIWGKRPKTPPRSLSTITLGLCQSHQKLIRIHPILDSARVPKFYLEYIVYHEMVHLAVPARISPAGKLMHHTRDFYEMEQQFPRYRQACQWQEANLNRLLRNWCQPKKKVSKLRGQLSLFR